jgi:hypothetical protein
MRALLVHWPHIAPVLLGFGTVIYLWVANRRWRAEQLRPSAGHGVERGAGSAGVGGLSVSAAQAPVRREAARRGALVLGPILAVIASGAGIYGVELAAEHPGDALVWVHVGFSLLVCLLAVYKLAGMDAAQMRRAWRRGRVLETAASTLLAALLLPLLLSGIVVLARPSGGSYIAYVHLIAGVWWTLLVAWHLRRYLARSLGALRISPARRTPPCR